MREGTRAWLLGLVLAVAGCTGRAPAGAPATASTQPPATTAAATSSTTPPTSTDGGDVLEPELRRELLDMMEADQAERTGEVAANNDRSRAERLIEIIDEHGWPTPELVGDDGATAAWLIAQHSDFDVEFQRRALELMEAALAADAADPTEVAYLRDRVAVNSGEPQLYGTQIRCDGDRLVPATPLAAPDLVDTLRAGVGLGPLQDYYDVDLAGACG